uniref:Uncharacterized protein n=1 Tax=Arundo donax TaxID=35708 RepID=A0A0A9EQ67_ARUDO
MLIVILCFFMFCARSIMIKHYNT